MRKRLKKGFYCCQNKIQKKRCVCKEAKKVDEDMCKSKVPLFSEVNVNLFQ